LLATDTLIEDWLRITTHGSLPRSVWYDGPVVPPFENTGDDEPDSSKWDQLEGIFDDHGLDKATKFASIGVSCYIFIDISISHILTEDWLRGVEHNSNAHDDIFVPLESNNIPPGEEAVGEVVHGRSKRDGDEN
jgi:hypothetical protein